MSLSRFDGPVYGAKSLLFSASIANTPVTTTTTIPLASIRVPAYEDWFISEFAVFRGSSGSTAVTTTYELADDSTVIANLVTVSSAANELLSTIVTRTPGEYEGQRVAANSTLTFQVNWGGSSAAVCSNATLSAYGYIRFVSSTRAE